MNLVFTLCSNNYLAQAITLGQTFLKFNEGYEFIIGLVDRKREEFDYNLIPYKILCVEDVGIDNLNEMVLKYNVVELNTAVKPFYFKHFFDTNKYKSVTFLDPDIQVFSRLTEVEKEFVDNDIIITPHFTTPINDDKWQAEEDFLNSGLYNLGFIAVKRSENSFEMIKWWSNRLKDKGFIDFKRGLFTDQIWINFVPLFFDKVKILKNAGYNVAYWNLHERYISIKDNNYYINGDQSLVFYHFASYKPTKPGFISSGQTRFTFEDRPDILPLFNDYREILYKNHYAKLSSFKCYFDEIRTNNYIIKYRNAVRDVPLIKKVASKIVRFLIKRFNLILDYSTLLK